MKVALIRPQRVFKKFNKALKPAPPLGIAYLAAAIERAGYQAVVIDGVAEKINQIFPLRGEVMINGLTNEEIIARIPKDADIIGVSCMFTVDWLNLRELINLIGRHFPDKSIIAGGEHVSALPNLCFEECPPLKICAIGEGEETLVEICNALEGKIPLEHVKSIVFRQADGGNLQRTERRQRISEPDSLQMPAWHLFPTDIYFKERLTFGVSEKRTLPILATRGCPYTCTFCSSPDMWGTRYFMRNPKKVVDEIEYLVNTFSVGNIDLYDLTAIIKAGWIIEFSKELINRKLNITWQLPSGTRSEAITPEALHYMKRSGCTVVTYAPESGSNNILKLIHKKVSLKKMLKAIAYSNHENIFVKINIIIGLPQEKHLDIWKTMWFILQASWNGAYDMGPNPFHPIPGTPLYDQLVAEKQIDMAGDKYYEDLLNADNLWKVAFYNKNVPSLWLKFYFLSYFFIFYTSNFIFRPLRFFATARNVITLKSQTRGQYVLQRILEQNRFFKYWQGYKDASAPVKAG